MNEHPTSGLVQTAIEKIKEMVDVSTVVGNPITTEAGVTIIPISRVSVGFASGGSDLPTKRDKPLFTGASGGGITVTPTGFLVINGTDVRLLPLYSTATTADRLIENTPGIIDKVSSVISGWRQNDTEEHKNRETEPGED